MDDFEILAIEARARRVAANCGLRAKKSRWRRGTIDNFGHFMLLDNRTGSIVAGERFDVTADDVIAYCTRSPDLAAERTKIPIVSPI